jgi:hypothetical protein
MRGVFASFGRLSCLVVVVLACPSASATAQSAFPSCSFKATRPLFVVQAEPSHTLPAPKLDLTLSLVERWDARHATAIARQNAKTRNWLLRHPAILGALVGYAVGYVIGYAPGDDGVFDDFTAGFNGHVIGGVGAVIGAITGAVIGRR